MRPLVIARNIFVLIICSQTLAELSSAGSLHLPILCAIDGDWQEGVSACYSIKVVLTTLSLRHWNLNHTMQLGMQDSLLPSLTHWELETCVS